MKPVKSILFCLLSGLAAAATAAPAFIGVYHDNTVDTVSELVILPDQTFCFAFSGGALDLLTSGTWQARAAGNGQTDLTFTEISPDKNRFAVSLRNLDADHYLAPENKKPQILLNGAALSMMQPDTVFGLGKNRRIPANLAPMFASGQHVFQQTYQLPLADNRYLFIGYPDQSDGYKISTFDIHDRQYNTVYVGYNANAARDREQMQAHFDGKNLSLNQQNMGEPQTLNAKDISRIKEYCQQAPNKHDGEQTNWQRAADLGSTRITQLPLQQPWFAPTEDENSATENTHTTNP